MANSKEQKIKGERKKGKNFSLIKRKTVGDGKANLYSKTGKRTAWWIERRSYQQPFPFLVRDS